MPKYSGNLTYRSRLARQENKRFAKQTILLVLLTIVLIILILFYGFPALLKLAVYLGNTKTSAPQAQDVIAPSVPQLITPLEATNSAALSLSGYGEAGSSVVLYQNGFDIKEEMIGEDGQFSFSDITLDPGDNRFFALSRDTAGNESQHTPTYTIIYSDTAPDLTIDNPADGASFFGALQQVISVSGHTVKDATVQLNDQLLVVSSDGRFSGRVQLSEGDNHYTVTATDAAGNSTTQEFTVKYSK